MNANSHFGKRAIDDKIGTLYVHAYKVCCRARIYSALTLFVCLK